MDFDELEKDFATARRHMAPAMEDEHRQRMQMLDVCFRHYCVESFVVKDVALPGLGVCAALDVRSCIVHDFDPGQCVVCAQRTKSHFMNDSVIGPAQCLAFALPHAPVILQKIPNRDRHNVDFVWARDGHDWTLCGLPVPASDPFLPYHGCYSAAGCFFPGEWIDVAVCTQEVRTRLHKWFFAETEHVLNRDGCAYLKTP